MSEGTGGSRQNVSRVIISVIALTWALFQLSLPRFVILDSITVRAIHLAFATALIFLIPRKKKSGKGLALPDNVLFIARIVFALLTALSVLYIVFDWEGIASRAGRPILRDLIISFSMIVLLLAGARRSIGWPMTLIAIGFSVYAFLGPHMPGLLGYRGISISKYVNQLALSDEGIYGIPLDVSANTVYLFVLFGSMMHALGTGQFFNDLAISLLGRFTGGPAKASVVSSGLTGLVSGSSIANVVTTGTFTIPLMKKVGYPAKIAAATEVAASTNGQLMPPIMGAAAFIIAEYLGIGYLEVIRAAAIPAFVSYIALFYIVHLEASRLHMGGLEKPDIPSFRRVMAKGWYHLLPLAMLVYQLIVVRRTPKLAAYNAIIALLLVAIVQRVIVGWKERRPLLQTAKNIVRTVVKGMIEGSKNMLPVALATATAGIVVGVVNTGIGSLIVQIVEVLSAGNFFLLLFITAIASLILGMGLPTTATYIVMASITVPVILELGVGIQNVIVIPIAAHLFCFYFGILADDTPPVGLAAYTAAAIAETDPFATGIKGFVYDLRTAIIPFMFIFNPELLLHGIRGLVPSLMIFVAAALGSCAFASAMQGWCRTKNRFYESLIMLVCSFVAFLPGITARYLSIPGEYKYLLYLVAAALFALVLLLQHARTPNKMSTNAA